VIQSTQIQEFVAETPERQALMTTRRARRYQRGGICKSANGEVWYGKYYPAPGAPQKRVQLGRTSEMDEKRARVELDDIVAVLNRNPKHVLYKAAAQQYRKLKTLLNRLDKLSKTILRYQAKQAETKHQK
jgi:hypothetical protein